MSDKDIYVRHLAVLSSGFIFGLVAAYFFNEIKFDFSDEIRKAKDLGIVSKTILYEYPKTKDVLTYVTVLCFPVMFSAGMWYFWARDKKGQLMEIFRSRTEAVPPYSTSRAICLLSALLFSLYISFNLNALYSPGWLPYIGSWMLLGEDGENLAWVQSILSGGVYGKDFFCLYGPMLIYPLAWVMKLFGETIVVERSYKYFLDLIAYFIVICFLFKTLRRKSTFLFGSIVYLFTFHGLSNSMSYGLSLSVNTTQLRVVLGILPLLLTYMYVGSGKGYLIFLGGVAVGQSLLFSHEVGFCSCVALISALIVYYLVRPDRRSLLIKHFLWFFIGCLISTAPMVIYLSLKGAFIPFI
ncbi:MAG TPA: hypothetical protein VN328_09570, partial [Thermodesulfovibrionales bacterium]|nr:hypothetical protein [Thermodesulfovibrionales bacterium]